MYSARVSEIVEMVESFLSTNLYHDVRVIYNGDGSYDDNRFTYQYDTLIFEWMGFDGVDSKFLDPINRTVFVMRYLPEGFTSTIVLNDLTSGRWSLDDSLVKVRSIEKKRQLTAFLND